MRLASSYIHTPIGAAYLVVRSRVVYAETMLERDAATETKARSYEAPPMRDRLPTIPHDLSEYARTETGPSLDLQDDPFRTMTSGLLLG